MQFEHAHHVLFEFHFATESAAVTNALVERSTTVNVFLTSGVAWIDMNFPSGYLNLISNKLKFSWNIIKKDKWITTTPRPSY